MIWYSPSSSLMSSSRVIPLEDGRKSHRSEWQWKLQGMALMPFDATLVPRMSFSICFFCNLPSHAGAPKHSKHVRVHAARAAEQCCGMLRCSELQALACILSTTIALRHILQCNGEATCDDSLPQELCKQHQTINLWVFLCISDIILLHDRHWNKLTKKNESQVVTMFAREISGTWPAPTPRLSTALHTQSNLRWLRLLNYNHTILDQWTMPRSPTNWILFESWGCTCKWSHCRVSSLLSPSESVCLSVCQPHRRRLRHHLNNNISCVTWHAMMMVHVLHGYTTIPTRVNPVSASSDTNKLSRKKKLRFRGIEIKVIPLHCAPQNEAAGSQKIIRFKINMDQNQSK